MGPKNRNTLKNYFRNGTIPTEDHFEDLVDSTLNIIDEGFDKSPEDGFKVSQLGDDGKLLSFYRDELGSRPLYFLRVDRNNNLIIGGHEDQSLLFLTAGTEDESQVRVGINTEDPESHLDVGGVIRSEGRIGVVSKFNEQEREAMADGAWHDITDDLGGCQAFEVMAGVGGQKTRGRYALMHATVLNTYNPKGWLFNFLNLKKRIKYTHAYYRSRADKLKLRWYGEGGRNSDYKLQIRSNSDFGNDVNDNPIKIRYYVTKLWFDDDMSMSRVSE